MLIDRKFVRLQPSQIVKMIGVASEWQNLGLFPPRLNNADTNVREIGYMYSRYVYGSLFGLPKPIIIAVASSQIDLLR